VQCAGDDHERGDRENGRDGFAERRRDVGDGAGERADGRADDREPCRSSAQWRRRVVQTRGQDRQERDGEAQGGDGASSGPARHAGLLECRHLAM